jgi:hypothetical protein
MKIFDIDTELQDPTLPGREFDKLHFGRLQQCKSVSEVQNYLSQIDVDYHRVKTKPHHPAYDSYRLVSQFTRHAIPIYLNREQEARRVFSGFKGFPQTQIRLFVLQCGGKHFKKNYSDGIAIFIDRNTLTRDAVFFLSLYFGQPNDSGWIAGYIAKFTALYPMQSLPFLDELLWHAMESNSDGLASTIAKLTHFIVLHEVGHVYRDFCGGGHHDYLIRTLDRPISESERENWFRSIPPFLAHNLDNPRTTQVNDFFLLDRSHRNHFLPHGFEDSEKEHFCDFYAWYNMLVLSQITENCPTPRVNDDEQTSWLLNVMASSLFLQELDQQSKNGVRKDKHPELITLNPWSHHAKEHSHPRGLMRWQSLAIHSCTLSGSEPWRRPHFESDFEFGFNLFRFDNIIVPYILASLDAGDEELRNTLKDDSDKKFRDYQNRTQDRWRNLSSDMMSLAWHVYGSLIFENAKEPTVLSFLKHPCSAPRSVQCLGLIVAGLQNAMLNEPHWISNYRDQLIQLYTSDREPGPSSDTDG